MPPPEGAAGRAALVALLRDEGAGVLATLARQTGSLQLAEDAVQDAAVRALEVWECDGVPPSPRAWLLLVARRRALDVLRREARRPEKEAAYVDLLPPGEQHDDAVEDDLLRLLFTCCHPALDSTTQVALALKWLCGLSTAQTARLLLAPESAMARRLSRARRKIAVARIPYRVPAAEDLPDRVAGVLTTVHLLFTEGYSATGPGPALHDERAAEALRLARLLRALLPDDAGVCGLLALVLLHSARAPARTAPDGSLVLLAEQDRALWSRAAIHEGVTLVGEGLARTPLRPDRYVVQAAIAACHCVADTWPATDWAAIVSWYDVLAGLDPSPVVRLNRAVAVAERDGAAAGLAELAGLELPGYALLPAARAELLVRLERTQEAAAALRQALTLPLNDAQRQLLQERLARLSPCGGNDDDPEETRMALVICDMSVSLDGYVTGPNDSRENPFGDGAGMLHDWMFDDATDQDRALARELLDGVGAVVMGRTSFDKNEGDGGWGEAGPIGATPCFVVTHRPPATPHPALYTFVTDGVVSAIEQARRAAGDRVVSLHGATVLQQVLPLGLVDELRVHVIPVLLGAGTPLFGPLDAAITLERLSVLATPAATHLRFRVVGSASTPAASR